MAAIDYRDRITIAPGKRGGKPCIRGLRITVYDVLEYLASGMSESSSRSPRETAARREPVASPSAPTDEIATVLGRHLGALLAFGTDPEAALLTLSWPTP